MIPRYSALLVSNDNSLIGPISKNLEENFNVHIYQFSEDDIRETLRVVKPLVILWDGRGHHEKWQYLLNWLREHFHGCPLLALLDIDDPPSRMDLYKMGINLIINVSSNSFHDNLSVLIGAIIADLNINISSTTDQLYQFKFNYQTDA